MRVITAGCTRYSSHPGEPIIVLLVSEKLALCNAFCSPLASLKFKANKKSKQQGVYGHHLSIEHMLHTHAYAHTHMQTCTHATYTHFYNLMFFFYSTCARDSEVSN